MDKTDSFPKLFYSINDLVNKWSYTKDEVLHQVGTGKLKTSVKIYGDYVAMPITGKEDTPSDQDSQNLLSDQPIEDELYELSDEYIPYLIKDGTVYIDNALCYKGEWSILLQPEIIVKIDDLVVKADEVKRFETESSQLVPEESQLSEKERDNLLKTIGALAMLLANSKNTFTIGKKPNANQISAAIHGMFDELEKENKDTFERYETNFKMKSRGT